MKNKGKMEGASMRKQREVRKEKEGGRRKGKGGRRK